MCDKYTPYTVVLFTSISSTGSQKIDPDLVAPVNIGTTLTTDLPVPAERRRILRDNRKDRQMEYKARHQECKEY